MSRGVDMVGLWNEFVDWDRLEDEERPISDDEGVV